MAKADRKVPKLRFPEYKDGWSERVLGNIAEFSKGKGIPKDDVSENGKTPCVRYGQLYTEYNEVIDSVISRTDINTENLILSKENDVIIPASGETQIDIATASCVRIGRVALGGDLNIIRTKNNGIFLAYYLNNRKKLDIARLSQGISVVHLYASQLKLLRLLLPSLPEQQKIASFLTAVDDKIQQLTKKKELLEQYKKGVMQKIFSQEIRFKDAKGNDYPDWEEKRMSDITNILRCGIASTPNYVENGIPFLSSQNVTRDGKLTLEKYNYISEEYYNVLSKNYKLLKGDLLYSRVGASYGNSTVFPHNGNFGIYVSLTHIRPKQTVLNYFLNYVLNSEIGKIQAKKGVFQGGGVPNLNVKIVEKFYIPVPLLEEQQKIADFLSSIDNKIELVNTRLEKTKEFKKGLLQQMFV